MTADGRNQLGFQDVIGQDYFAQKNKGTEIEISGRILRGWRMTGSFGTGRIDAAQKPAGSTSAPGLAVVNTAITAAVPGEQQNAISDCNNFWVAFDSIFSLKDTIGIKRVTAKLFTDYTVQEGRFRSVRFGLGANWVDKSLAGYRSGDTVANPNFNPNQPVTAANRPWRDDPTVDANTPVWIKQPFEVTGTLGYTMKLKSRSRLLAAALGSGD